MATSKVISSNVKRLLASKSYAVNVSAKHSVWTAENTVKSPFVDVEIPNRTLTEHIWENLGRWPDKTAMVCGITNRSMTYHELYKYSRNFAAQLRTKFNISDGDVVCIMSPNMPEFASAALGASEAGASVTTINPIYTAYEVKRQIILSNPKILIGTKDTIPVLKEALKLANKHLPIITYNAQNNLPRGTVSFEELIQENNINHDILKQVKVKYDDIAFLPYSSGTTGMPKGVELTNRNIVANCVQGDVEDYRVYRETTNSHQEQYLAVLPFYHIYGLSVLLLHKLAVGAKIVTLPKFEPKSFIKALEDHKISMLYSAPPLVLFLASYPGITSRHLETIKWIASGAAPLPRVDVENVLRKAKHDLKFIQVYGLTETSPLVTMALPGSSNYSSAGYPISNTELRIVDSNQNNLGPNEVGELYIRGPQVMKGYRNNPEATKNCLTDDGWFKSGDLACIAEDGSLTIQDRLKDLIKVKGYQVAPAELESVIKEHPSVLDAGVIGVSDQKTGERPRAFVVLKEGRKETSENISEFVAERVAEFKKLKDVTFLDSLPKNASGKLLRKVLKEEYASPKPL